VKVRCVTHVYQYKSAAAIAGSLAGRIPTHQQEVQGVTTTHSKKKIHAAESKHIDTQTVSMLRVFDSVLRASHEACVAVICHVVFF
jgi:hypothetical protein